MNEEKKIKNSQNIIRLQGDITAKQDHIEKIREEANISPDEVNTEFDSENEDK